MLTLRNGPLQAQLWLEAGGRIASLTHTRHGDILVPMNNAPFDPEYWPKAGAYPLIPFHNRVRGGKFTWQGRDYQLPCHPTEPNTLHGFSSRRVWSAHDVTPASAVMELIHTGDEHWPWPLLARQDINLDEDGLRIELTIRNDSDLVMPAGLGWHPYFVKASLITSDARLSWPIGPDLMPFGSSLVGQGQGDTRYLAEWQSAILDFSGGARVVVTADPLLSHLVLHDAAPSYSCVEPASHLANALADVPAQGRDGMYPLAPGQTLAAGLRVIVL